MVENLERLCPCRKTLQLKYTICDSNASQIQIWGIKSYIFDHDRSISKWKVSFKNALYYPKLLYLLPISCVLCSNFQKGSFVLPNLNMGNSPRLSSCVKLLGFHIQDNLKWDSQIDKTSKFVSTLIFKSDY